MCGGYGKRNVVDRDDTVVGMRNCGSKCSNRINLFGVLCLWRRKNKEENENNDSEKRVNAADTQCRIKRKVYTNKKEKTKKKKRKGDDDEEKSARSSLIGESK